MKKIAVCISGQVRSEGASLKGISEAISEIDADVFVSVWKRKGTKNFSGFNSHGHLSRTLGKHIGYAIPETWTRNMGNIFFKSEEIFPPLGDVTEAFLQAHFPGASIDIEDEDISFEFSGHGGNSFRMLYKIWRCNSLMRKAELAAGKRYDLVVRMRPDIAVDFSKIPALELGEHELLTMKTKFNSIPGAEDAPHLGDMYWVGSSETVERMAGGFARAIDAQTGPWRGIHRELYEHAIASGLTLVPRNLMTRSIKQFANLDPDYIQAVRQNLVSSVRARRINVEAAGGEAFCAVVADILTASLREAEGEQADVDAAKLIEEISGFAAENPEHAIDAYLMAASFLVRNRQYDLRLRFEFLLFWIKTKLLHSRRSNPVPPIPLHYVASMTAAFKGQKPELLALVSAFIEGGDAESGTPDFVPAPWEMAASAKGEMQNSAIYARFLECGRFYDWLTSGHDASQAPALAILEAARQKMLASTSPPPLK